MVSRVVRKPRVEECGELIELALGDVAVDVLGKILKADLAADFLAEKSDIRADDRPKIEEHGLRTAAEPCEELLQHLGRLHGPAGLLVVFATAGKKIGKSHRRFVIRDS